MTDPEWNDCVEACAVAAEQQDKAGREWVGESLWAKILARAGAEVRKLKRPIVTPPAGHEICSACQRVFKFGETCTRGGCPCGGDI